MTYCRQYSTLAPLLIKVKQKKKSDGNFLTALHTVVSVYLWHALNSKGDTVHQHHVKETRFEQISCFFYQCSLGDCPWQ